MSTTTASAVSRVLLRTPVMHDSCATAPGGSTDTAVTPAAGEPHEPPANRSMEGALSNREDVPAVIQAAIARVQFETIHPFLDRVRACETSAT